MPSLKDLKDRIGSVKNTQKITKAMKMVAAAKLRRAREAAEASRPYAQKMEVMVQSLATSVKGQDNAPLLLKGTGNDHKHLIIVATADRGLCGGFNGSIARAVREKVRALQSQGKEVKLFFVGRKGREILKSEFGALEIGVKTDIAKTLNYGTAREVSDEVLGLYTQQGFDVVHIVYNRFVSAISQVVKFQQLVPLDTDARHPEETHCVDEGSKKGTTDSSASPQNDVSASYEYEPDEEQILADLLPRNVAMQIFRALLENAASEQGARMSAMDNATRNAGDMINKLTLQYNRSRQAAITKELIEIISGAEAL